MYSIDSGKGGVGLGVAAGTATVGRAEAVARVATDEPLGAPVQLSSVAIPIIAKLARRLRLGDLIPALRGTSDSMQLAPAPGHQANL